MTIGTYQTLYESAVAFGMRKALQTEQGKSEMEARMQVRLAMIVSSKFNQTLLGYVDPINTVFNNRNADDRQRVSDAVRISGRIRHA